MIRLHIIAEGQTEQSFAQKVLIPHLAGFGVSVVCRCVQTRKNNRTARVYRGGLLNYQKAQKDILAWIKEDNHAECRFTTMFDLYALPNDFPGYTAAASQRDPYSQVRLIEEAMATDINDSRFIPYIQLHEFEALILADPQRLAEEYLDRDLPIQRLVSLAAGQNPELINDGPDTAPSKRILKELPEYHKATAGPAVARAIRLPTLRAKCRHFAEWLARLENFGGAHP